MPKILSFDRNNNNSFNSLLELYNSWLNQELLTTSSPTFENLEISNELTINGVPVVSSQWTTTGNDIYYSTGNVGISTNNPFYSLDVNGDVGVKDLLVVEQQGGGGQYVEIDVSNAGINRFLSRGTKDLVIGNESSQSILFNTNLNIERMRIDSSGNVGIGTTDTLGYKVAINEGDLLFICNGLGYNGIYFTDPTNTEDYFSLSIPSININVSTNPITFGTSIDERDFRFTTFNGEVLRIKSNGNVGIGTADPGTNKLQIQGQTQIVGNGIITSGNLGIGTTSPESKLDLYSSTVNSSYLIIRSNASSATDNLGIYFRNDGAPAASGSRYKTKILAVGSGAWGISDLHFCLNNQANDTNNAEVNTDTRLIIKSGGNVGIGTTTPGYSLDVTGDINCTGDFRVNGVPFTGSSQWTTSGSDIYYTTGDVGIGTTDPDVYKLNVQGDLNFTGTLYQNGSVFSGSSQWVSAGNDISYQVIGGAVGIATDANIALGKLHVNGAINGTDIRINGNSLLQISDTIDISSSLDLITNASGSPSFTVKNQKYFIINENAGSSPELASYSCTVIINSGSLSVASTQSAFQFIIPNKAPAVFSSNSDAVVLVQGFISSTPTVNIENCVGYTVSDLTDALIEISFTSSTSTSDTLVFNISVHYEI